MGDDLVPLKPGQRRPTRKEMMIAEREAAAYAEREQELIAKHRSRYRRGKGGPATANPCSGGLPSLGKRR